MWRWPLLSGPRSCLCPAPPQSPRHPPPRGCVAVSWQTLATHQMFSALCTLLVSDLACKSRWEWRHNSPWHTPVVYQCWVVGDSFLLTNIRVQVTVYFRYSHLYCRAKMNFDSQCTHTQFKIQSAYLVILPGEAVTEVRPWPRQSLAGNTPDGTESHKRVAIIVDDLGKK